MKKETMYKHVESWLKAKGKISKAAFCTGHKVSHGQLSYWLARYNKELNRAPKKVQEEFIPVHIKEEPTRKDEEKARAKIEIVFPTGVILRIY